MLDVKVTTCAPEWPWARQTPSGTFVWGDIRFHVDREVERCDAWVVFESMRDAETTLCPLERTYFITGEPDSIGRYGTAFTDQFRWVVTGRTDIAHPGLIRRQQGHPWFVEKSFDELTAMEPPAKSADVCIITSDKLFTPGHRERLQFALDLKARLGARLDIWGRGLRDFSSSWDVLSRYRYAVVLENFSGPDWLTEKLPDALLAWCVPLYNGCTNLEDYLPAGSWIDLPALDADKAAELLLTLLADRADYDARLGALASARHHYLHELQFFANIAAIVQQAPQADLQSAVPVRLYPDGAVPIAPPPAIASAEPLAARDGLPRKVAGLMRVSGWRLLQWADELRPLPAPPPPPPPPPAPPPPPPPSLKQIAHASWLKADGDRTLRLNYAIGSGEVVLDVGGFEGQWASDIFGRYLCTVHVFEPVPHFAASIRSRFAANPHVRVHEAALGGAESTLTMAVSGDASSALLEGAQTVQARVRRFADVMQEHGWSEIALMKVNIEGGEYELLEHLLDTGLVERVRNLQVQFHDFVDDAALRMKAIQERLSRTHHLTYLFPFIWENWERKETQG